MALGLAQVLVEVVLFLVSKLFLKQAILLVLVLKILNLVKDWVLMPALKILPRCFLRNY